MVGRAASQVTLSRHDPKGLSREGAEGGRSRAQSRLHPLRPSCTVPKRTVRAMKQVALCARTTVEQLHGAMAAALFLMPGTTRVLSCSLEPPFCLLHTLSNMPVAHVCERRQSGISFHAVSLPSSSRLRRKSCHARWDVSVPIDAKIDPWLYQALQFLEYVRSFSQRSCKAPYSTGRGSSCTTCYRTAASCT